MIEDEQEPLDKVFEDLLWSHLGLFQNDIWNILFHLFSNLSTLGSQDNIINSSDLLDFNRGLEVDLGANLHCLELLIIKA